MRYLVKVAKEIDGTLEIGIEGEHTWDDVIEVAHEALEDQNIVWEMFGNLRITDIQELDK